MSKIQFDWDDILCEALARRPELRRQRMLIKRREMELSAYKNFLLPTLNLTGGYHFQGFGNKLFGNGREGDFDNAYQALFTQNLEGWNTGLQFSAPLGYRKGHMLVRNAEIAISRERAVLLEQERDVVHNLSNAIADLDRAYAVAETNFNRRTAARQHMAVVQAEFEADKATVEALLYAQLRLADSDAHFYRSLVEYVLAIKNVHYEKNSVLDYNEVYLTEGPWSWRKAGAKSSGQRPTDQMNYVMQRQIVNVATPPQRVEESSSTPVTFESPAETPKPTFDEPPPPFVPNVVAPTAPFDAMKNDAAKVEAATAEAAPATSAVVLDPKNDQ